MMLPDANSTLYLGLGIALAGYFVGEGLASAAECITRAMVCTDAHTHETTGEKEIS